MIRIFVLLAMSLFVSVTSLASAEEAIDTVNSSLAQTDDDSLFKKYPNSKLKASYQLLSEVEPGSYVKYIGNNGCGNTNCDGTNTSNGYCYDSNYKYNASGWRIAYIDSGSVYITVSEYICQTNDIFL